MWGSLTAVPLLLWLAIGFLTPMATVVFLSLQAETGIFAPISLTLSARQFTAILGDSYYLVILGETAHLN